MEQGKFGWYPCNWETFRKLKVINMAYDKAQHDYAIWQRWNRKDAINRVSRAKIRNSKGQVVGYGVKTSIAEPPIPILFCQQVIANYDKHGNYIKEGFSTFIFKELPIYEDYKKARYPTDRDKVENLILSAEEINNLYEKLKTC